jgi:GTP-binding protein YchF
VPDSRLDQLAKRVAAPQTIHATVEFVDIAGLVRGASKGEGLGNQFLAQIRDADAIVHVVRCFDDPNVVHVSGIIDPYSDIEIVDLELMLADLEQLERKIARLERLAKGDPAVRPLMELARTLAAHLGANQPVRALPDRESELFVEFNHEMRFLTGKPVIFIANVAEEALAGSSPHVEAVGEYARAVDAPVVVLCAELEASLASLDDVERAELLELAGVSESGLEQVIRRGLQALQLISFFTFNDKEARAWTLPAGSDAVTAAGAIHTDFARGFIRAEVIHSDRFAEYGSWVAARATGQIRSEGRTYIVHDGDVILFRFNV